MKIAIADIKPNPAQPRKTIHEVDMNTMIESIRRYGIITPIVIDKNKMIIDGQTRLIAASRIGITELEIGKEIIIRDLDSNLYGQIAHTRTEPPDLDKAEWLEERINKKIATGGKMSALQILTNAYEHIAHGTLLKISKKDLKELYYIIWTINPGDDEFSLRKSIRLIKMLDWPEDLKEDYKSGYISRSTAEVIFTIKEPKIRKEIVEITKEKNWNHKIVRIASQSVNTVDSLKEKKKVMNALKGGIEPESVKRVVSIKNPKVRNTALDDLQSVAKSSKEGETYVVEIAEEVDAKVPQPIDIRLSNPENRYIAKLNNFYIKVTEIVNGTRIARMKNEVLKDEAIRKVEQMIHRLESELEEAKGEKTIVVEA